MQRPRRILVPARWHVLHVEIVALSGAPACVAVDGAEAKVETQARDCASCHADEARMTSAPPHAEARFGEACEQCHDEERWSPARAFLHVASFPLTRGHAAPGCADCHATGFSPEAVPNDCATCHGEEATSVIDPIHEGLPQSCFACHRTDAFAPALFVHAWPLEGVHALTACRACHQGRPARYEGLDSACLNCHAGDFARASEIFPAHAGFPTECKSCHGFTSFKEP